MVFRVVTWIIAVIIGAVRALCDSAPLGLPRGEVTGQGRPRSPKMVQKEAKERTNGKDSLWWLEALGDPGFQFREGGR